jgi:hypothetical protein
MKQALHIFAKDARHFWPEILLSLAVTAMFAWTYPTTWKVLADRSASGEMESVLARWLVVLVPVGWGILITRLVHGESLVGDKQWWITKPYEWPQLLGAKLLFVAAFVLLPFFVAQSVLLQEAGFRWLDSLPGLGFSLLLMSGIVTIPLLALAAVISSFSRMVLTILGLLLGFIVMLVVATKLGGANSFSPYGDPLSIPILLCFGGAAIALQYARRMAWRARLVLAAAVVLMLAAGAASCAPRLVAMAYPVSGGSAPLQATYDPNGGHSPPGVVSSHRVALSIPVAITGVAPGMAVRVEAVQGTFEAGGQRWTSAWESTYGALALPGAQPGPAQTMLPVQVDRRFFDRVHDQAMNVRLTMAITQLRGAEDRSFPLGRGEFAVPDVGICSTTLGETTEGPEIQGVTCRSPMREPKFTYVDVRWAEDPCPVNPEVRDAFRSGREGQQIGDLSGDPAQFGIVSVWMSPVWLGVGGVDVERNGKLFHGRRSLCPGMPIHFTRYTLARRTQIEMTMANYHFPSWPGSGIGGTTLGVTF